MVNVLKARKVTQRAKFIVGGTVATGVVAGGIFLASLGTTGTEQRANPFPAFLPVVIDVSATGSTVGTLRYDAFCVRSPLYALGNGSGTIVRATHHNVTNPAAKSMDVGFVEDCNDKTASGNNLFSNTCTATGCVDYYTTGTLGWQGAGSGRYLKGVISGDPTSSYDAKITIWLEDVLGE
jgi:hypothetical protein